MKNVTSNLATKSQANRTCVCEPARVLEHVTWLTSRTQHIHTHTTKRRYIKCMHLYLHLYTFCIYLRYLFSLLWILPLRCGPLLQIKMHIYVQFKRVLFEMYLNDIIDYFEKVW